MHAFEVIELEANIFSLMAEVRINPVNCVGVSGKGLALSFKVMASDNQTIYEDACANDKLRLGELLITEAIPYESDQEVIDKGSYVLIRYLPEVFRLYPGSLCAIQPPFYTVNFPTKWHWSDPSALSDITNGLYALRDFIFEYQPRSVALPAIGCGLGGLPFKEVSRRVHAIFTPTPRGDLKQNTKIYFLRPSSGQSPVVRPQFQSPVETHND